MTIYIVEAQVEVEPGAGDLWVFESAHGSQEGAAMRMMRLKERLDAEWQPPRDSGGMTWDYRVSGPIEVEP